MHRRYLPYKCAHGGVQHFFLKTHAFLCLCFVCTFPFCLYACICTAHGAALRRWSLAGFTALYLLVGFLVFVFAPALVFTWLEGWSYRESVYYAFITLSTIGFGDYTAG